MKSFAVAALLGATNAHFGDHFKNWVHKTSAQFKEFKDQWNKPEDDGLMTPADYEFMRHVIEYGKSYGTKEEYEFRAALFKQNLAEIEAMKADPNVTHEVGINEFSTWTPAERAKLTGYKDPRDGLVLERNVKILDESNLADEVNWVTKGAVTPVKNQGQSDHAGLSQPLDPWKVPIRLRLVIWFHFLSNNLLTAHG